MDKHHYIVNVEAAIFNDDRWLVAQRSEQEPHAPGLLSMIGGKVEVAGQSDNVLEDAVIREVKEEVGIDIEVLSYVHSNAFETDDGRQAVNIIFLCQHRSGEPKPLDAEEIASVSWMSLDEILNNPKTPEWTKTGFSRAENKRREYEKSD